MIARPLIGILVPDKAGRQRILRAYGRQCPPDMTLFAFCPGGIDWERLRIAGVLYGRNRCDEYSFPFPDTVYNRIHNASPDLLLRLEANMGGGICFNRINFFDKWTLYDWLKPTTLGPSIPDSRLYSHSALQEMLARHRLLYLKPCYGARGNGVYRVERTERDEVRIGEHHLSPRYIGQSLEEGGAMIARLLESKRYLIQQGIPTSTVDGRYFDIRSLLQKDGNGEWKVSTLASRIAYPDCFNTSVCEDVCDAAELLSRSFAPQLSERLLRELHDSGIRAAAEVEARVGPLGEMSVDFLLDPQQQLWMIELNGKPDKVLYKLLEDEALGRRIYRRPMAYAQYLAAARR
ncbi:YheC/YheD family endospore coat-associated protein [Cohnella sp. 56]|uniref:YheC/YheD family endospore coat-associated protein n=1 Tax=Cohnella sp. 56 TaxID=3113722 RepID=UPI0030E931F2